MLWCIRGPILKRNCTFSLFTAFYVFLCYVFHFLLSNFFISFFLPDLFILFVSACFFLLFPSSFYFIFPFLFFSSQFCMVVTLLLHFIFFLPSFFSCLFFTLPFLPLSFGFPPLFILQSSPPFRFIAHVWPDIK